MHKARKEAKGNHVQAPRPVKTPKKPVASFIRSPMEEMVIGKVMTSTAVDETRDTSLETKMHRIHIHRHE